jgi:hypothetical protein
MSVDDGGNKQLSTFDKFLQDYMAQHPRRQWSECFSESSRSKSGTYAEIWKPILINSTVNIIT